MSNCPVAKFRTLCIAHLSLLLLATFLLIVILPAKYALQQVKQDEYVVWEHTFTGALTEPYSAGRFNLEVASDTKYTFKSTVQAKSLRMTCMTKDMMEVMMDITVSWRYFKDRLKDIVLIRFFDESYYQVYFESEIQSALLQACGLYTARQFSTHRAEAERNMFATLTRNLLSQSEEPAVEAIQYSLTNIALPQQLSDLLSRQIDSQTQLTQELNSRASKLTEAQSQVLVAQKQAEALMIAANQTATIILAQARASESLIFDSWTKLADALVNVPGGDLATYIHGEILRARNTTGIIQL